MYQSDLQLTAFPPISPRPFQPKIGDDHRQGYVVCRFVLFYVLLFLLAWEIKTDFSTDGLLLWRDLAAVHQ